MDQAKVEDLIKSINEILDRPDPISIEEAKNLKLEVEKILELINKKDRGEDC